MTAAQLPAGHRAQQLDHQGPRDEGFAARHPAPCCSTGGEVDSECGRAPSSPKGGASRFPSGGHGQEGANGGAGW